MGRALKIALLILLMLAMALPVMAQTPATQAPPQHVALVIANGAYESVPRLAHPARDGR